MEHNDYPILALAVIIGVMFFLVLHITLSTIDKEHCEAYGLSYKGTDYTFMATCITPSGKEIPANLVGNENW